MRRMLFALLLGMLAAIVFAGVALAKDIDGTEGSDTIIGTPQADLIKGLGDIDRVYAIGGDDVVYGNAGGDRLVGDNLPEAVREEQGFGDGDIGLPGNDKLFGGKGADRLFGNEGDDILNAGQEEIARYDELTGGRGEEGGSPPLCAGSPLPRSDLPAADLSQLCSWVLDQGYAKFRERFV